MTYLRDVLSQGRSLSHRLLDLDLGKGRIWTYLRPDVSVDYAQCHLNQTWLVSTEIEGEIAAIGDGWTGKRYTSPYPLYVEFIHHFLQRTSDAYCIIEDALGKRSDPFMEKVRHEPFAFREEDIFYVLNHESGTVQAVETGLRTTNAWIQTVALCRIPANVAEISPWMEITDHQMSALVNNVDAVLVEAFDGVGYVIWEKESLSP